MIIFICGFMGAGKSTLLKRLINNFEKIGCLDLDDQIFQNTLINGYKLISDFIKDKGILEFRKLELEELQRLLIQYQNKDLVLALGGGSLEHNDTFKLVKGNGKILWLKTDFEVCFERIKDDDSRPLAFNHYKKMKDLFDKRSKLYQLADQSGSEEELTEMIKEWIYV